MKSNKYINEPQVQRWREKQDCLDEHPNSDRAIKREKKRKVRTFGIQIKPFIEAAWWNSFNDDEQISIYDQFYRARNQYYYNTRNELELDKWIKNLYLSLKPNTANYRKSKIETLLKND